MSDPLHNPNQIDSTTALRARKQPQPGDVLDGIYRLDRPLGKGGVGIVYRAFHLHLQRPCAIKFMHPQLVANAELRTRFRREAQSAFQLGHPHIVAITDFRDDPNAWPYLVMELVVGETLRDRLERGPLEPRLALRLMIELCDALSAAHRRGVIHRDLKPENLFLTRVQSPGPEELEVTLKVLDFGLSKLLDGVEITGSGRLLGSPSYMSPEQARGESNFVDVRSDIFAVGALLYECLAGEKMCSAEGLEQKRQLIMAAKLPPLKFAEQGLPLVDKIIARACALKPEMRYQTATALQSALEEAEKALEGKQGTPSIVPIPVVVPSLSSAAPPRGEGSSAVASVGGGELVSTSAGSKRRRLGMWLIAGSASLAAVALGGFAGYSAWRTFAAPRSVTTVPTAPPVRGQPTVTAIANQEEVTSPKAGAPAVSTAQALAATAQPVAAPQAVPPTSVLADDTPKAEPQKEKRDPASTMPLRLGEEHPLVVTSGAEPAAGTPIPEKTGVAPPAAPPPVTVPSAPAGSRPRRSRGSGKMVASAAGPSIAPAAPTAHSGSSLIDIVHQANETLRRATPAVKRCYPENVIPPDKISVDVTIQADGRVSDANIDGAEDAAGCVLRVLRGLRFSPSADSDSYATRYDFVNLRR